MAVESVHEDQQEEGLPVKETLVSFLDRNLIRTTHDDPLKIYHPLISLIS